MKKFLCKLCGYVHECESLEINYVCPVCGVNASQFEEFTDEKEVNNRVKIYESDIKSDIKYSHDNKDVQKVYNEFLGEIGGEKAHKMLHTEYTDKSSRLKIKVEN